MPDDEQLQGNPGKEDSAPEPTTSESAQKPGTSAGGGATAWAQDGAGTLRRDAIAASVAVGLDALFHSAAGATPSSSSESMEGRLKEDWRNRRFTLPLKNGREVDVR